MPEPHKGESRDDFMSRCMSDPEAKSSFPDDKQRVAFCESQFDRKKKKNMPVTPSRLRAAVVLARPGKIDRERGIIYGYTAAQVGPFKSEGRGEFNLDGLKQAAKLMNMDGKGVKSRFTHPTLSEDGLGKFLGRARDARVEGDKVKADLYLSPTSRNTPSGDLGGYVMDLAESDPAAFGTSLVLEADQKMRLDDKGRALMDDDDNELPPLWMPTKVYASDVVDEGDAVHDGFLSLPSELRIILLGGELPDQFVRQGSALLDSVFAGQPQEVVEARVKAWLNRYCELRYGAAPSTPRLDKLKERLDQLKKAAAFGNS